jgi:isoleucyl-tRNA synthetase
MATETPQKKNYKQTLNLPDTAFPMEAKLVANEPARLRKWQEMNLYAKLLAARARSEKWVLHDGPPFANGDIHIGHLINKTLKDAILRFRTMQGFQTPYVPGWDCHGLPIEHKIQEELKSKIREMSVPEVRKHCFEYAKKYVGIQSQQFQRLGILGDWEHPYLTLSPGYEAATLEVFAKFVEAGLVYKKLKPVPWSVRNQTALADAELEYQDVEDTSIFVEFPLLGTDFGESAHLLIWTTTPWTLPANLAVAVHPDVMYVPVEYEPAGSSISGSPFPSPGTPGEGQGGGSNWETLSGTNQQSESIGPPPQPSPGVSGEAGSLSARQSTRRVAIVAGDLVEKVFKDRPHQAMMERAMKGSELAGREYSHPFITRKSKIVTAEYVTTTDGTGLVHTAPGHGEDDYETGMRNGLDVYSPVLANGRFDDTVPEFIRGKTTKEANPLIIDELRSRGLLFAEMKIVHSYPHDWRSKTPIIFRATEQWFIAMNQPFGPEQTTLRQRAIDACASSVEFVPDWGKHRITGMLQSRPDWCISRQRVWGLPIPVFYNEQGHALLTPGSVRAVSRRFAEKGSEAWFSDSPAELLGNGFRYPPGFSAETLRKEKDIFDVWFESGSSWHAVLQGRPELKFPADLYLEGSDQHRGWFQLSLLPSLGATGVAPFRQVLTHGFVVKPDGKKVSKSDKEYVTATQEIDRHGADLLRLWCCSVDYQTDIPVSPPVIQAFGEKYRKIRNTLRYLLANLDDFDPRSDAVEIPPNSLDGWALFELDRLIAQVTDAYEHYQLHRAFRLLYDFCAVQISAVYGNAMKDRLYCEAVASPLRRRSQTVLQRMAMALTKLLAPMLVFTADEVWEHLRCKPADEAEMPSVHLALLPKVSGDEPSEAQQREWELLMELRDNALLQLDGLKKEVGLNKASEAEIVYQIDDDALRLRLQAYGPDLEDLVGAGSHSFAEKGPEGPAVIVKVLDRRNVYPACARSWKRRPDVGTDPEFPDLSLRDAAVVRESQT